MATRSTSVATAICAHVGHARNRRRRRAAVLSLDPTGGVGGGGGTYPGACSGGYHLPSEAIHHPGPCGASLTSGQQRRQASLTTRALSASCGAVAADARASCPVTSTGKGRACKALRATRC